MADLFNNVVNNSDYKASSHTMMSRKSIEKKSGGNPDAN
jgi:hypothetical protein